MSKIDAYVICTTPRSGSTLLCDLLTATGVAGQPDSFFRKESFRWWADYLQVNTDDWTDIDKFDQKYLDAIIRYGKGSSPVFAMRLMWQSLDSLCTGLKTFHSDAQRGKACFESAFGSIRFIHLSRLDKAAQAISRLKAEQSGLWHRHADGRERERLSPRQNTRYDFDALLALVKEFEEEDQAWINWFEEQKIDPISISYETLSTDPCKTISVILANLGLDSSAAKSVKPQTAVLSDTESVEWLEQFKKERSAL